MWETARGVRVLGAGERHFFCVVVDRMLCRAEYLFSDDELFRVDMDMVEGICWAENLSGGAFDELHSLDQLLALRIVTRALLDPATPAPVLTATLESAVYYVYRWAVQHSKEYPADFIDHFFEPLWAAVREVEGPFEGEEDEDDDEEEDDDDDDDDESDDDDDDDEEDDDKMTLARCRRQLLRDLRRGEGEDTIENLADCILWDRDFQMEDLDVPPGLMGYMRIVPTYFTEGEDKLDAELAAWRAEPLARRVRRQGGRNEERHERLALVKSIRKMLDNSDVWFVRSGLGAAGAGSGGGSGGGMPQPPAAAASSSAASEAKPAPASASASKGKRAPAPAATSSSKGKKAAAASSSSAAAPAGSKRTRSASAARAKPSTAPSAAASSSSSSSAAASGAKKRRATAAEPARSDARAPSKKKK